MAGGTIIETLLRVKRAEGCDCDLGDFPDEGGLQFYRVGMRGLLPCPHGSTVQTVPARVVECEECRGEGRTLCPACQGLKCTECDFTTQVACSGCLGTGLRWAKARDEIAEAIKTVPQTDQTKEAETHEQDR